MQKTTPDSPPNFALTRRSFLAGGAAFAGTAAVATGPAFADGVKEFALTPAPATLNLVGEQWPKTDVWCFNGRVPGPEIRARQGDRVRIRLANGLAQPTTVHWHGLRIPNAMDGVPDLTQAPVPPGGSFVYEFTLPDAGTFWYHPHVLSSEQVGRGLYGPLIVEEANPPRVDRDLTWVIDDWRLTKDAAIADDFNHPMHLSHGGRTGNTITVNGKPIDTFSVRAGERIRLRLISTANARIFSLHFKGHAPTLIAFDGQPVEPHAAPGGRVTLGSGQRVDLILDAAGKPGEKMEIVDDYYQRSPYVFADIAYSNEAPLRESPLDATVSLNRNPLPELDLANAETHPVRIE
ncbi:MAG: multicopper oxidase domain-containing protein, partial [Rhodospirillales bacterium]|nr:multicopper oxidase domain-containing protein [Rhodospirillales bacterium]